MNCELLILGCTFQLGLPRLSERTFLIRRAERATLGISFSEYGTEVNDRYSDSYRDNIFLHRISSKRVSAGKSRATIEYLL